MCYNESFANSFRYGLMFGKDIEPGTPAGVSVRNKDDILLAVKKAYIDMSPRTFKSVNTDENQNLDSKRKDALFQMLAEKIYEYIKNGADNFDAWHGETCKLFMQEFSNILEDAGKNRDDATYGKAQKIVNMTMKYLYCFDDAKDYYERFLPCHMALDSYILNWVNEWFPEVYNREHSDMPKLSKSGKWHLPSWSSLKYEAKNGDVPQYIEIQTAIKTRVAKEFQMPPIEAEFMIWYRERKKVEEKAKKD